MAKSFLTRSYKKLPFALPSTQASKAIADREHQLDAGLLKDAGEPTTICKLSGNRRPQGHRERSRAVCPHAQMLGSHAHRRTYAGGYSRYCNDCLWIEILARQADREDDALQPVLQFGMAQKYVDDLSRNVKRGLRSKAEMGWLPGPTQLDSDDLVDIHLR